MTEDFGASSGDDRAFGSKTLKERLARYMDPQAFEPVPDGIKFTSRSVGLATHDRRKARRTISLKRADAAIRFFLKPENARAIEARRAETGTGSVHESAVPEGCAPNTDPQVSA